jgi:hypothetical protein
MSDMMVGEAQQLLWGIRGMPASSRGNDTEYIIAILDDIEALEEDVKSLVDSIEDPDALHALGVLLDEQVQGIRLRLGYVMGSS